MTLEQLLHVRELIVLVHPHIRLAPVLALESAAVNAIPARDYASIVPAVQTAIEAPFFNTILKTRLRVWLKNAQDSIATKARAA